MDMTNIHLVFMAMTETIFQNPLKDSGILLIPVANVVIQHLASLQSLNKKQ